jgi:hypothetical protein
MVKAEEEEDVEMDKKSESNRSNMSSVGGKPGMKVLEERISCCLEDIKSLEYTMDNKLDITSEEEAKLEVDVTGLRRTMRAAKKELAALQKLEDVEMDKKSVSEPVQETAIVIQEKPVLPSFYVSPERDVAKYVEQNRAAINDMEEITELGQVILLLSKDGFAPKGTGERLKQGLVVVVVWAILFIQSYIAWLLWQNASGLDLEVVANDIHSGLLIWNPPDTTRSSKSHRFCCSSIVNIAGLVCQPLIS